MGVCLFCGQKRRPVVQAGRLSFGSGNFFLGATVGAVAFVCLLIIVVSRWRSRKESDSGDKQNADETMDEDMQLESGVGEVEVLNDGPTEDSEMA